MKYSLFVLVFSLLLLHSCKEEEESPSIDASNLTRIIVSNEGQFNSSNASISVYYPDGEVVQNDAYQDENGVALGDILQSISEKGDELYAVMNNSGKVEVLSKSNFATVGVINGLTSPRYLQAVTSTKAYVSDLFGDITIVDLEDKVITGSIATGGVTTGAMLKYENEAYVCFEGADAVQVYDVDADTLVHTYQIARTPIDVIEDAQGKIWMLFSGAYFDFTSYEYIQEQSHLVRVDPVSREILLDYQFAEWGGVQDMEISGSGQTVFILKDNDLLSISIDENEVSEVSGFDLDEMYYGRLGVDPNNGDIYLAKAGDFVSPGTIQRYSSSGALIIEFPVGVAPNGVIFD